MKTLINRKATILFAACLAFAMPISAQERLVSERGDVISFARNPATGRWHLRVLEPGGAAYEFERAGDDAPGR